MLDSFGDEPWCLVVGCRVVEAGDDVRGAVRDGCGQRVEGAGCEARAALAAAEENRARADGAIAGRGGLVECRNLLVLGECCLEKRLDPLPLVFWYGEAEYQLHVPEGHPLEGWWGASCSADHRCERAPSIASGHQPPMGRHPGQRD
jgi:hypothetical protein